MMKKKSVLSVAILLAALPSVLSAQVTFVSAYESEYIWIRNDLGMPCSIYCEFLHKDGNPNPRFPHESGIWDQMLAGRDVECFSLFETGVQETFHAGPSIMLVNYTSWRIGDWPLFLETLDILAAAPLEEKLRGIFKTLVIEDADGRTLLTLDEFSRAKVVVPRERQYYIVLDESLYE